MSPSSAIGAAIVWDDAQRAADFAVWLRGVAAAHALLESSLRPASADASFRRYFRIDSSKADHGANFIIMDAPPAKEDCQPFVKVAALMAAAGLTVPDIVAWDEAQGFMLLTDLGARTMMEFINPQEPEANFALYMEAVDTLIAWQLASKPDVLPLYDETLLRRELALFPDWYLARHRQIRLDDAQQTTLDNAFSLIVQRNLAVPSVYVHRDFMPRNLMLDVRANPPRLGVLDFQDAVYGPITYDIASLMRDAFLSWEEPFVLDITIRYWQKAVKVGLLGANCASGWGADFGEFYRAVEWMGLQRHLKILGIFARLTLRDGKPKYLADTPRFIAYVRATADRYRELGPFLKLLDQIEGIETPMGYSFGKT
ncbi:MAG: phosphotransferase [Burkholderiaceae bacterium]|nr:phosphotransferase [Burkholderiaceae bacterium]